VVSSPSPMPRPTARLRRKQTSARPRMAGTSVTFPQKSGHRVMLFSGLPALG
jgi:hypothetical protein